jgi:hypothetical protein
MRGRLDLTWAQEHLQSQLNGRKKITEMINFMFENPGKKYIRENDICLDQTGFTTASAALHPPPIQRNWMKTPAATKDVDEDISLDPFSKQAQPERGRGQFTSNLNQTRMIKASHYHL